MLPMSHRRIDTDLRRELCWRAQQAPRAPNTRAGEGAVQLAVWCTEAQACWLTRVLAAFCQAHSLLHGADPSTSGQHQPQLTVTLLTDSHRAHDGGLARTSQLHETWLCL